MELEEWAEVARSIAIKAQLVQLVLGQKGKLPIRQLLKQEPAQLELPSQSNLKVQQQGYLKQQQQKQLFQEFSSFSFSLARLPSYFP